MKKGQLEVNNMIRSEEFIQKLLKSRLWMLRLRVI